MKIGLTELYILQLNGYKILGRSKEKEINADYIFMVLLKLCWALTYNTGTFTHTKKLCERELRRCRESRVCKVKRGKT